MFIFSSISIYENSKLKIFSIIKRLDEISIFLPKDLLGTNE